jgi:xanthine dehydrogenase accessory factor
MPMIEIWKHALNSLSDGLATVLVVVVDHTGSVPGTTGATMVVTDRACVGTVGGGVAEHEMIERARKVHGSPELITIEHTPRASGSLCSGQHTLALVPLIDDDLPSVHAITATLESDGAGTLHLSHDGLAFEPDVVGPMQFDRSDGQWRFATPIGRLDTLHIIGGGHVALALSRVMATLPFRIVVLDNRPELPTLMANSFAHETRVIDYREVAEHVSGGDRSWVVVMTYGHENDALVLRRLLGLPLRYLGLLGSAAKVTQMFARFRDEGVPEEQLEPVSAPIGVSIGSHTPEEIAISIAAEIIQVRNKSPEEPGTGS